MQKDRIEAKMLDLEEILKKAAALATELDVSTEHIHAYLSQYLELCHPPQLSMVNTAAFDQEPVRPTIASGFSPAAREKAGSRESRHGRQDQAALRKACILSKVGDVWIG